MDEEDYELVLGMIEDLECMWQGYGYERLQELKLKVENILKVEFLLRENNS